MTTVYIVDEDRIYTGETRTLDSKDPVKPNYILTPPPGGIGYWIWDGHKWFNRQERPTRPAPATDSKITRLAMRNRFTFAEKVAIETAAQSSVPVRIYLDDLAASSFIDLSGEDTIDAVNLLENQGVIGIGRANEILTSPVQADEKYNG